MADEEDKATEPEDKEETDSEIGPASGKPGGGLKTIRKLVLVLAIITLVLGGALAYSEDFYMLATSLLDVMLGGSLTNEARVRSIVLSDIEVKNFVENSSDTDLHVSHFWLENAKLIFEQMRNDCNLSNQSGLDILEIYRVMVDEKSTNKSLVAWVDWGRGSLICVAKSGNWTKICASHVSSKCYDNNFYWYNSCGEREDMKLSCFGICTNNMCLPNCVLDGQAARPSGNLTCCEGLQTLPNSTMNNKNICIPPINDSFQCTRCGNGLCQPPENECSCPEDCNITCEDTDELDKFTQGRVTRGSVEKWDMCLNDENLTEYYCEDKAVKNTSLECYAYYNYTCRFGKCVNSTIPCIPEGGVSPADEFYECCKDLEELYMIRDPNGGCKVNAAVFVCAKCGDGECGLGETLCNCYEDCFGVL